MTFKPPPRIIGERVNSLWFFKNSLNLSDFCGVQHLTYTKVHTFNKHWVKVPINSWFRFNIGN